MFGSLKRHWRALRSGHPGNRFLAQYERSRRSHADESWWRRYLPSLAGAVMLAAGIFFLFIPGPGLPLIFLGAGLVAQRFRAAALALDWLEVKIRKVKSKAMAWWRKSSIGTRSAAVSIVVIAMAVVGYGAFHVVFG